MFSNEKYLEVIKEFNNLIYEEITNYYDMCSIQAEFIENLFKEVKYEFNSNFEYLIKDEDECIEMLEKLDKDIEEIIKGCIKYKIRMNTVCEKCIREFFYPMFNYVLNQKDRRLLEFRMSNYVKSVNDTIFYFSKNVCDEIGELVVEEKEELNALIDYKIEEINLKNKNKIKEQQGKLYTNNKDAITEEEKVISESCINQKSIGSNACIFDYKTMSKIALDKGYNYKYSNGSHNIYEHSVTSKIVVIPSHSLGKGLSKKIEKQIYYNSI